MIFIYNLKNKPMGLDTSHDAWHGPYSSFNQFRHKIAEAIGVNLDSFEGYGGNVPFDELKRGVRWLLDHSDCDGHITPKRCKLIADDLKKIIPLLEDGVWSPKSQAIKFMKGCLKAYKKNEKLDFH
jgi:hypothetical protein